MSETTLRVRISGTVQGVGFRAWTRAQAEDLRLRGWVQNEPDGTVTAVIAGNEAQVMRMLAQLRAGPPGADVDDVTHEPADMPVGSGFEIKS
jgi:acylphosphatase